MCSTDFFLCLLACLFPPLPVWVKRGICSADSLINIMLCVLGFLPGLIHSWYIVIKYPDQYDSYTQLAHEAHHSSHGGHHHYFPAPPQNQHYQSYLPHQQPHYHSQPQYSTFQQTAPAACRHDTPNSPNVGSRQPERYTRHEQQTPPETPALGPGEGSSQLPNGAPPSYASVVKGDHKIQTQD